MSFPATMPIKDTIQDPFGNTIHIPERFLKLSACKKIENIRKTITAPAFVIKVGAMSMYFFRLVQSNENVMIEVRFRETVFQIKKCTINPLPDQISRILGKGELIRF
jgi:hypothetical protein